MQLEIQALLAKLIDLESQITPAPWYYNSYSDVHAGGTLLDDWEAGIDSGESEYPAPPRPGSLPEHQFFDDEDTEWEARRNRAYELDISVASVPALYGDTAEGRHRADAQFIEVVRNGLPQLLWYIRTLETEVAQLESQLGNC